MEDPRFVGNLEGIAMQPRGGRFVMDPSEEDSGYCTKLSRYREPIELLLQLREDGGCVLEIAKGSRIKLLHYAIHSVLSRTVGYADTKCRWCLESAWMMTLWHYRKHRRIICSICEQANVRLVLEPTQTKAMRAQRALATSGAP
jgi:hypothetical protein